jgi:dolichyl-phosphate-mannose-protein mannosyltransferase
MGRTPILVLCLGLGAGACSQNTLDSQADDAKLARENVREKLDVLGEVAKERAQELKNRLPEVQEGLRQSYEAARIRAEELKERLPSEAELREKYEEARLEAERLREKLPSQEEVQEKLDRASEAFQESAQVAREKAERQLEDARARLRDRL